MDMRIIPAIGLTGLYKLSSKLDNFYNKDTPYTCKAIRRFDDIVNAGEDIFYDYYQTLGLTESDVALDLENNACIVALTTPDNKWIYIPSSTIIEVPDQSGISYTPLGLYATLGAIDDTYDLGPIKTKVSEIIQKYLSHISDIQIAVIGNTEMVNSDQHANIVRTRSIKASAKTTSDDGTVTDPAVLMEELTTALSKLRVLEEYLISVMPIIQKAKDEDKAEAEANTPPGG